MKSTFTAVLWFYDDEKLEERRMEILEEIRRNMTPGQRARFNSPISAQQRVLDELRTRGLAVAKKPRAPKPANDLDQANARIVELEEELKSARSIAPVTTSWRGRSVRPSPRARSPALCQHRRSTRPSCWRR